MTDLEITGLLAAERFAEEAIDLWRSGDIHAAYLAMENAYCILRGQIEAEQILMKMREAKA